MMLPGFGIVSEVISVFSRKPIFGYRLMALSLMAIVVLGFSVWAHHMFVSGMAPWLRVPMMITTLLIAVPTGIKIFSWLATMWEGKLHFNTPMLFALGFLSMFVIGGLSGVMLGAVPIDIHVSDTYFIVAHIHYVLFGGSVFTIFAGMYYWFPKMTGRMYNERLGKLHFWLTFVGFNLTFFPMHLVGMEGMPRRVADYAPKFANLNMFISLASFGLGMSTIVFLYNMITSWRSGPIAPSNPWRGDDARVAGQLAAAALQLRRDPAGRRIAVRVRRSGRGARNPHAGPRSGDGGDRPVSARRRPPHSRRRQRDVGLADAHRPARGEGQGRRRAGHRALAGHGAAPGLRRLLRHAPRGRAPPARPDARARCGQQECLPRAS